jgi:hypothetical protein
MKQPRIVLVGTLILLLAAAGKTCAAEGDSQAICDLNTPREFPATSSREQWQARAKEIREQVLVSCGLWPMPKKTPLNAQISGRIEREGYTVEKVALETWPGFYLGGNLYRPLGKGHGPFPAILNPHGHWSNGRMADTSDGSIAARCISFARQGMIAFSYDMLGYNDTHFAEAPGNPPLAAMHRSFGTNKTDLLWNISGMGLQTWNSIRALDFLQALPDADPKRLAITGESGGGTQTFILGAIDDRLAAQAPVVMVSHTMQGGCVCENSPGLRVEYSNMEIAAAAAPRPQIIVGATGDWTKATLTVEGPAIAHIYELFGQRDKFNFVRFDFNHNYNQTSREAVYAWLGKWLPKHPLPEADLKEKSYKKEPDADLRVFPDAKLPAGALTQSEMVESLKASHRERWQGLVPRDGKSLDRFKTEFLPAWRRTLDLEWPADGSKIESGDLKAAGDCQTAPVHIAGPDGTRIAATYWAPADLLKHSKPKLVVLSGPKSAIESRRLAYLKSGIAVLELEEPSTEKRADPFVNFYTTYNRTILQRRVRGLLAACAAAKSVDPRKPLPFHIFLDGAGRAGIYCLLAAPAAEAVVADGDGFASDNDDALLEAALVCPGIRNIGTYQGGAMLVAGHPLLLHNTQKKFSTSDIESAYQAAHAERKLRIEAAMLKDEGIAEWLSRL